MRNITELEKIAAEVCEAGDRHDDAVSLAEYMSRSQKTELTLEEAHTVLGLVQKRLAESRMVLKPATLGRSRAAKLRKKRKAEVTDVIFRVWKGKDGGVIAIFPTIPSDYEGRYCEMYEHVGGHGGGDYLGVVDRTLLAQPEHYARLKAELEGAPYHYKLRVCERQTPQHRAEYAENLRAIK